MSELRRVDPGSAPTLLSRLMARIALSRVGRFVSRHVGWKLDPILLRLTGNRIATTVVIPTAVLETRGARSGETRRNAVIYFHDGDRAIVAASYAGARRHPDWFHNVVAHPEVSLGGVPMRAAVVEDPTEQERLWGLADRVFPGYEVYRRQAGAAGRTIPLLSLTPI